MMVISERTRVVGKNKQKTATSYKWPSSTCFTWSILLRLVLQLLQQPSSNKIVRLFSAIEKSTSSSSGNTFQKTSSTISWRPVLPHAFQMDSAKHVFSVMVSQMFSWQIWKNFSKQINLFFIILFEMSWWEANLNAEKNLIFKTRLDCIVNEKSETGTNCFACNFKFLQG